MHHAFEIKLDYVYMLYQIMRIKIRKNISNHDRNGDAKSIETRQKYVRYTLTCMANRFMFGGLSTQFYLFLSFTLINKN